MQSALSWGLDVIRGVQAALGLGVVPFMKFISVLGSEYFAIAALPLIYWCVDRKKGARVGIAVIFSSFLNLWLKLLFAQPRPYDFEPGLGLARESTFGLPSGHSQMSVVFWGSVFSLLPRFLGVLLLLGLPLLVGFSRIYLGLHFPTDVFAGWALGVLVLVAFKFVGTRIEALLHTWGLRARLVAVSLAALAMNALMPSETLLSGAFFGSSIGFALASDRLRFDAGGSPGVKLTRYVLGMAGTLLFYLGPKFLLGDAFPAQAGLVRFLRYGIVGFWVALGAPWLFLRLRLVGLEPAPAQADPGVAVAGADPACDA